MKRYILSYWHSACHIIGAKYMVPNENRTYNNNAGQVENRSGRKLAPRRDGRIKKTGTRENQGES